MADTQVQMVEETVREMDRVAVRDIFGKLYRYMRDNKTDAKALAMAADCVDETMALFSATLSQPKRPDTVQRLANQAVDIMEREGWGIADDLRQMIVRELCATQPEQLHGTKECKKHVIRITRKAARKLGVEHLLKSCPECATNKEISGSASQLIDEIGELMKRHGFSKMEKGTIFIENGIVQCQGMSFESVFASERKEPPSKEGANSGSTTKQRR